jgi:pyridoxal/pyridoxine/pyridoxamine kinase
MGDDGALYIEEGVVPIFKSVIPFTNIILPNQFEAKVLSGCKLDSLECITVCLNSLHQRYWVANIVISSLCLESHPGIILCCGSMADHRLRTRASCLISLRVNSSQSTPYIMLFAYVTADCFDDNLWMK